MRHQPASPYTLKAKFVSVCAETGKTIKPGDTILYYPRFKKAYCQDSKSWQDWQSSEFDRIALGASY